MRFEWPEGFARMPEDDWTHRPVEDLALKYDTVENHGWYRNLELTLDQLDRFLRDGDLVIDYSGGTGIFVDRLLRRRADLRAGLVIVDASPKFLRRALDKFRDDGRVAFRQIRYLPDRRRLEWLDEVLGPALVRRGADAIVSTNAVHLYYDLVDTLASWSRTLRPGGRVFVQSGNIRNPAAHPEEWIIDETVDAIHCASVEIVRRDERFAAYRQTLRDLMRMAAYDAYRRKIFLPVRPLDHYLKAMARAGLRVEDISTRTIEARVDEWYDFLAVYHEGVLGWIGGVAKVDGRPPAEAAVRDRLRILRQALQIVFEGKEAFDACWTYIVCGKQGWAGPPSSPSTAR
ncbi:MAG: class I SAM-dependent methyltransferase [Planctomycetes bacterium]|nr:class I SAM-dependent methyltransferase [Planctomycetota bacterium]